MKQLGKDNSLKGFETVHLFYFICTSFEYFILLKQAKDIYLHPELFTIENNLLTPTMKTKRPEVVKYFAKDIEEMYKNIE